MRTRFHVQIVVLCFIVTFGTGRKIWKKVDLRAVTYFANIRGFYHIVKAQKPLVRPQSLKDGVQKNICRNIFNSHYFQTSVDEEWVDMENAEVRKEILDDQKAHSSMFKLRKSTRKMFWQPEEYVYDDEDVYRDLPIYVDDNREDEYMFKCLGKGRETRELKEYFVSREYDVAANEVGAYPVAGRFVFSHHPTKFLVIRAMAEEVAKVPKHSEFGLAEFHYSKRRKKSGPTKTPEQDPVCKLSPENQLRLCAIIFGSTVLRKEVDFMPSDDSVQLPCEKRRISFMADVSSLTNFLLTLTGHSLRSNRNYEEWTIGCKAFNANTGAQSTYFVSRGDYRNTVFVYTQKQSDERIFASYYLRNISVVGSVKKEDVQMNP